MRIVHNNTADVYHKKRGAFGHRLLRIATQILAIRVIHLHLIGIIDIGK